MLTNIKSILKNEKIQLHTFISNNPDYTTLSISASIAKFKSHQISNKLNLYLSSTDVMYCVQPSGIEMCEHSGNLQITNPETINFQAEHPIIVNSYEYINGSIIITFFEHEAKKYQPLSEPSDTDSQFRLSNIRVNYYDQNLYLSRLELSTVVNINKKEYPINIKRLDIVKLFLRSKPPIENVQKSEFFDLLRVFLKEYQEGIHLEHFNINLVTFKDVLKKFPNNLLKFKSGNQTRVPKNNLK